MMLLVVANNNKRSKEYSVCLRFGSFCRALENTIGFSQTPFRREWFAEISVTSWAQRVCVSVLSVLD